MLKLHICTDNAAFEDEPASEIARILRDSNGNRVGECTITED